MSVIDTFLAGALRTLTSQIRLKGGIAAVTLTGAVTVTSKSGNILVLDPAGASRDVTMPPEESCEGAVFVIYNTADAAENLVIKNDAAGTIVTIGRGESYIVACNGTAWSAIPMRETEGAAGALAADTISEFTAATGVTVDGTLIKDGSVTTADAGSVTTNTIAEKTAASGVTVDGCLIKDGRAAALATAAMFMSAEVTGNGASQDTAHGLGATPTLVYAIPSDLTGGAFTVAYGVHDATNAKVTVTTGEKYRVVAFK